MIIIEILNIYFAVAFAKNLSCLYRMNHAGLEMVQFPFIVKISQTALAFSQNRAKIPPCAEKA